MSSTPLILSAKQEYLNLETYRRNGQPVQTPVWFAEDDRRLYIRTLANSGKIKRIRNNPEVRIAPCDAGGKLLGEWIQGQAFLLDADRCMLANRLLNRKYGFRKRLYDLLVLFQKNQWAAISIEIQGMQDPS